MCNRRRAKAWSALCLSIRTLAVGARRRHDTPVSADAVAASALFGRTEQEAFFVRCDRTTMTADDILNGRLVCEVGVAPVRPAEFVVFQIFQNTADAQR